ncbi:MAG: hypothetical protein RR197_03890, partial [Oscillospiraceae bacterium]
MIHGDVRFFKQLAVAGAVLRKKRNANAAGDFILNAALHQRAAKNGHNPPDFFKNRIFLRDVSQKYDEFIPADPPEDVVFAEQ